MKRQPEPLDVWHWKLQEDGQPCEPFTVVAWDREHQDTLIAGVSLFNDRMNGFRVYDGTAFTMSMWHHEDDCS